MYDALVIHEFLSLQMALFKFSSFLNKINWAREKKTTTKRNLVKVGKLSTGLYGNLVLYVFLACASTAKKIEVWI